MANKNIPQSREAIAIIDLAALTSALEDAKQGVKPDIEQPIIYATRNFYKFLSLTEDTALRDAGDIAGALTAIDTNNTSITQINADLVTIIANAAALAAIVNTHVAATSAHGANGDIVGTNDLAQPLPQPAGVVNQAQDVGDPAGLFTTLAIAEGWAEQLRDNLQAAGIMA